MPLIRQQLNADVSYFSIGSHVQHAWFVGDVVGINCPRLLMWVRVKRVLHPAAGRAIGVIKAVPFNHGKEVES